MKKFKITKSMHNKVKSYFKKEFDYTNVSYHEDLSLYGFTNITVINENIIVAHLRPSGYGNDFIIYRFIDPVHYHHIQKLDRLRTALNKSEYKNKMYNEKRTARVRDWFKTIHNEVYKRKIELT